MTMHRPRWRSALTLVLLAILGAAMTGCCYHGNWGYRCHVPVRVCR